MVYDEGFHAVFHYAKANPEHEKGAVTRAKRTANARTSYAVEGIATMPSA